MTSKEDLGQMRDADCLFFKDEPDVIYSTATGNPFSILDIDTRGTGFPLWVTEMFDPEEYINAE